MHGAKKKKGKRKFGGLLASLPPERNFTWFSDDLQQCYERPPIHPPKHGLPANCAIDSWPWLSRVSVLGAPVPCTLVRSCLCKTLRCERWSSSTPERPLVRRIILTGIVFFFLCINMNMKNGRYILDGVMRVRLNLPTAQVLHFELSAVVLVATGCCSSMY